MSQVISQKTSQVTKQGDDLTCLRCRGHLEPRTVYGPEGKIKTIYCVNCGEQYYESIRI